MPRYPFHAAVIEGGKIEAKVDLETTLQALFHTVVLPSGTSYTLFSPSPSRGGGEHGFEGRRLGLGAAVELGAGLVQRRLRELDLARAAVE